MFNTLSCKDLVTADDTVTTPFELFVGSKPMVSHFRVFGRPCFTKKWTTLVDCKPEDNSKGIQRGIKGIHLGFSPTQKGLLLFVPFTRKIVISGDVICDETFASAVAETWRPYHLLQLLDPLPHLFLIHSLCWNILDVCCPSLRRGILQPIIINSNNFSF
jgi:hypothetical protein